MKRINVVGTSGSGKSTFARRLAEALDVPYVEMDALYWKSGWREPDDDEFFPILERAIAGDAWVLDGNYRRTTSIKWRRVDTVVWLDYGFVRTLWRIVKRSVRRAFSRRELWPGTGNRESFRRSFFSRQSMILWTIQTHRRRRAQYGALMHDERYAHIRFVRLTSPGEARAFVEAARAGARHGTQST